MSENVTVIPDSGTRPAPAQANTSAFSGQTPPASPAAQRASWLPLSVLPLFAVLTLIMTYSLSLRLTTTVLGAPGDNFEYLFKLRLFADSLLRGQAWPLITDSVYYPFGYDLRYGDTTLISLALALPVVLGTGEVAGYNWIVMLSSALSGFTAYLLARLIIRQQGPAIIAGLLYTFSTYRMYRIGVGHFNQYVTLWIPLMFLYVELAIRRRQARFGALAGLNYALTGLTTWNYAYVMAIGLFVYTLARARPWRAAFADRRLWQAMLSFGFVALAILGIPALHMLQIRQGAGLAFSLADADVFSGDLLALLAANPAHPLAPTGSLAQSFIPPIGWIGLVLAVYAIWHKPAHPGLAFAVLLIVAGVMTWGLTLHWHGQRVYVPVPGLVERAFVRVMSSLTERVALYPQRFWPLHQQGTIFLPLPGYFLFLFLPLFSALREWATFVALINPAVAVLAACALSVVRGRWRPLFLGSIALLALIELTPLPYAYGYSETFTQPLTAWLKEHPDSGVVARFPVQTWTNGANLYDGYTSGHPFTDGYVPFQPLGWRQAFPLLNRFPSQETVDLLQRWGVRYIVVSPAAYAGAWPQVEQQIAAVPVLRPVATVPYMSRFRDARLTPAPPLDPTAYVPVSEWMPRAAGTVLDTLLIYELVP